MHGNQQNTTMFVFHGRIYWKSLSNIHNAIKLICTEHARRTVLVNRTRKLTITNLWDLFQFWRQLWADYQRTLPPRKGNAQFENDGSAQSRTRSIGSCRPRRTGGSRDVPYANVGTVRPNPWIFPRKTHTVDDLYNIKIGTKNCY